MATTLVAQSTAGGVSGLESAGIPYTEPVPINFNNGAVDFRTLLFTKVVQVIGVGNGQGSAGWASSPNSPSALGLIAYGTLEIQRTTDTCSQVYKDLSGQIAVSHMNGLSGGSASWSPWMKLGFAVLSATIAGATQAVVSTRYVTDNTTQVVLTLPTDANSSVGDQIHVRGKGTGGWKIAQNASQVIHGASDSTAGTGGSLASQSRYDTVALEKIAANEWSIIANRGTLTIV